MFGCPGLWADGNIFALVWREGRIALKLPLSAGELRQMPGARDWTIGARKKMGAWVLVPEGFHDDADALARWARRAHQEVLAAAAEVEPARRKPAKGARKSTRKPGGTTRAVPARPARR